MSFSGLIFVTFIFWSFCEGSPLNRVGRRNVNVRNLEEYDVSYFSDENESQSEENEREREERVLKEEDAESSNGNGKYGNGSSEKNKNGPVATLEFLRKFGYLARKAEGSSPDWEETETETLYSEESVKEAIREMQEFAGIKVTGEMDETTLQLLSKPRCGNPDIFKHENNIKNRNGSESEKRVKRRAERFVIGSNGWNKRLITYSLENWHPKLGSKEEVMESLKQAFTIWGPYSNLNFQPVNSSSSSGDISIQFGSLYHGDRFPFDGTGGILAHAYFPYDYGSIGGDIHFDWDENWASLNLKDRKKDEENDGISFLSVTAHELGHSLGLSHSPVPEAMMFPYYKNFEHGPRLDYDDILAVYKLYIERRIEEGGGGGNENDKESKETEDEDERKPASSSTTTTTSTTFKTTKFTTSTPDKRTTERATTTRTRTTTDKYASSEEKENEEEDADADKDSENKKPNLCKDRFDTISFIRNEIFVFKGNFMWRLRDRGELPGPEYPVEMSRLFPPLKDFNQIDAAFEKSNGDIIFFSGDQYLVFDGQELVEGPKNLRDLGLPPSLNKLDGAFIWERNQLVYFFRNDHYWRLNETLQEIDTGYPLHISKWGGVPSDIQSVLRWKDGKTYFFKDDYFWRFDDYSVYVEEGYPLSTKEYWFGC